MLKRRSRIGLFFCFVLGLFMALLSSGGPVTGAEETASDWTPRPQQEIEFEADITVHVSFNYLLYLPEGYESEGEPWPLILFLHGSDGTGDDLSILKTKGPPKIVETEQGFPFIVVSPQSPEREWDTAALNALLDDIIAKHNVDEDRIYLTGLSMGGYGAWALAAAHPERFAAVVPVCGGGDIRTAERLKDLPHWVFHGARDLSIPVSQSERMVRAIEKAGGNVKFTKYPHSGHNAWTKTYSNPRLYEWLLEQKRPAE